MLTLKNHNKFSSRSMSSMLLRFSLMFFTALIIAVLVQNSWTNHINLYHTILETACVFIALSIFTSIWYTCDQSHDSNHILGFGYLAVAIFDALHAYYHLKLDLTAISYYDLSTRFWILGRLTEAVTILMVVTSCKIFITKYINILITLGFAVGVSYFVVAYHDVLPLLLTAQGVTPLKKFLEYAVIAIYIISLLNM
ncbi:MAG TPA: MASE3 domain-containing protein, partial [Patescibacteria group bacterium]|nr:MASE3 domain-containing protein [Patescibacteria group bacterium]